MTNDEIRRNDEIRMTKPANAPLRVFRHSGFGFLSSFVICYSSFIAGLFLLGLNAAHSGETNKVQHAKLKISGFGPLGNRELKKTIRLMSGKKIPPEFYEANFVEDAALIIMSTLNREGYLAPHISAALTLTDGQELSFEWDKDIDTVLPGPLAVKKVRFRVRQGARYYYRHLSIHGLKSLSQSEAKSFFVETGFL